MILNCVTVDDEPLALNLVSAFARQTPFLNLVGQYANGIETLEAIQNQPVHLVFLDIQMPELNGMQLGRLIRQASSFVQTRIVFTTAYNQFAVEGYKVDALDYLLKPFGYEEFLIASSKVKSYFEHLSDDHVPKQAADEISMFVKSDYKLVRVDFDNILYVEFLKEHVKIHLAPPHKPVTTLTSSKMIEERLPRTKFLRVHRSFIVAINKIDSFSKSDVHIGNTEIPVGDSYKDPIRELLGKWG